MENISININARLLSGRVYESLGTSIWLFCVTIKTLSPQMKLISLIDMSMLFFLFENQLSFAKLTRNNTWCSIKSYHRGSKQADPSCNYHINLSVTRLGKIKFPYFFQSVASFLDQGPVTQTAFPPKIQIGWEFGFTITVSLVIASLHDCAHATTALLSSRVQHFPATTKWISTEFELRWKLFREMASACCYNIGSAPRICVKWKIVQTLGGPLIHS